MKLSTSSFAQVLTVILGFLSQILPAVPDKFKKYILAATGIITIILHLIAGNSNPDGTPSSTHNSIQHQ